MGREFVTVWRSGIQIQQGIAEEIVKCELVVFFVCSFIGLEVEDECSTAKALVMLEYAVDARATENKKKIIHYHDEVLYMIYWDSKVKT